MAYVVTPPATVGVPVNGTGDLFRSAASSASAATTPPTPARWDTIPTASRPSSSPSRPTRS